MRLLASALIASSVLLPAIPSFAQTAEQRAACEGDFKKLCQSVTPGGGRILKCLQDQKDKVSENCRKVLGL